MMMADDNATGINVSSACKASNLAIPKDGTAITDDKASDDNMTITDDKAPA